MSRLQDYLRRNRLSQDLTHQTQIHVEENKAISSVLPCVTLPDNDKNKYKIFHVEAFGNSFVTYLLITRMSIPPYFPYGIPAYKNTLTSVFTDASCVAEDPGILGGRSISVTVI